MRPSPSARGKGSHEQVAEAEPLVVTHVDENQVEQVKSNVNRQSAGSTVIILIEYDFVPSIQTQLTHTWLEKR